MIRLADDKDRMRVVRLLKEQAEFAGFSDGTFGVKVPLQGSYGVNLFNMHTTQPNCVCIVYEHEDHPGVAQGVLLGATYEHPMGPVRIAKDTAFYLRPKYRQGSIGIKMTKAYEEWAMKDQRCDAVVLGALAKYPEVCSLYERLGYKQAEVTFIKSVR